MDQVTLDIHGHLFKDLNFGRQQADLLYNSFTPIQKALKAAV
jgi:hypothetical protein